MKILMICTGNTCRSPMAEGIAKKLLEQKGLVNIEIGSMGLGAIEGEEPTANAMDAMKEIGIDISSVKSRRVTLEDLTDTDLIYAMTSSHKNILLDAVPELEERIVVLDIADPYGHELDVYRDCRDRMVEFFTEEWKDGARFGHAE